MSVLQSVKSYLNPYTPIVPKVGPQSALTTWGSWGPTSTTSSGQNVTQETATSLLTVYGCMSFIANMVSTLPLQNFRGGADGPVKIDNPRFLEQPNPECDRISFIVQCVMSFMSDGNLFIIPVRDARGAVLELWCIDPARVRVHRDRPGSQRGYDIDNRPYLGELIHVPWIIRPGAVRGLSPIESARQTIGLGMAAVDHGARFFGQGAQVGGVVQVPGELSEDQAAVMANAWRRAHSGPENAHLPGVLTAGATWKETQITNEQAQFLETRRFTAAEICAQLFLLDPSNLGIGVEGSSLTYANLEQRGIQLVQVTGLPFFVRLEELFTRLSPRPQYTKFNVAGLMRADTTARYAAYRVALDPAAPFMTVDQVRALEEWGPMPEGMPNEPA